MGKFNRISGKVICCVNAMQSNILADLFSVGAQWPHVNVSFGINNYLNLEIFHFGNLINLKISMHLTLQPFEDTYIHVYSTQIIK